MTAKSINRTNAQLSGAATYLGIPCRHGHVGHRMTKTRTCVECRKILAQTPRVKEQKKAYYDKHRERYKQQLRDYSLRQKYGLTPKDYDELIAKQNNKCAICTRQLQSSNKVHVDHCHVINKVRGILCSKCNVGLGQFGDSIIMLRKALAYLESSSKTNMYDKPADEAESESE